MAGRPKIIKPNQIRKAMLEQLEKSGCKIEFYQAMVDKYVFCEEQIIKLENDINENGTMVVLTSAQGKEYDKENPAIKLRDMYLKQQSAILRDLGLNRDTIDTGEDDESYCDI